MSVNRHTEFGKEKKKKPTTRHNKKKQQKYVTGILSYTFLKASLSETVLSRIWANIFTENCQSNLGSKKSRY